MTREQEVRKEIELQLYTARPLALSPATMMRQARKGGLNYTATEMARECDFLVGQGILQPVDDPVSGEQKYAITSKGIVGYERAGGI
jgi:hypothetical protein